MAAWLDGVLFTPTLGGTTDWIVSAFVIGYNTPALAGAVNGTKYKYHAQSADLSQWEDGEGTYTVSTTTLTRTTVLYNSSGTGTGPGQSGAGSKINFTTVPTVSVVALKEDMVSVDDSLVTPQGRLTLQSGVPVMATNQVAKSTVYYDSYKGAKVWIYNGSVFVPYTITSDEISMGLDAVTPHVASGSAYDVWAINNGGAPALCIGPAWSSLTSRGTGAGTTEWQWLNGVRVSKNILTHAWGGVSGTTDYGPVAVGQATLLGSLYATANGQTGMAYSVTALGGGGNILGLYNAYNREPTVAVSFDSTASWTCASTTFRKANSSASNAITYLDGLAQSAVEAIYNVMYNPPSAHYLITGISLDWTSGVPTFQGAAYNLLSATLDVPGVFPPALGLHVINAVEAIDGGTGTFFATNFGAPTTQLQSLAAELMM